MGLKALLVAEGSGGHLIPALETAAALVNGGSRATVWYARRRSIAALADELGRDAQRRGIRVEPITGRARAGVPGRLWETGQIWRRARRTMAASRPDVVVGFGGWICAPVIAAARGRGIPCMLHEQNGVMGRANRLLSRFVDCVAASFPETPRAAAGARCVVTGLPIREEIGTANRRAAATRFGFDPEQPTLLVLGGSQGSRVINTLATRMVLGLSQAQRETWQILHLTGTGSDETVRDAYAAAGLKAWVAPWLAEMALAYAVADIAIGRAGASTVMELAHSAVPAILIPYPHAQGHQRVNARAAERVGGAVVIEQAAATPDAVLVAAQRLLDDARLRRMMAAHMKALAMPDAARRLAQEIARVAGHTAAATVTPAESPAMAGAVS